MSFPPGTEMFQFPGFAPPPYGFRRRYRACAVGCPIRRSPDQSPLAAPRGLSQRATSFIASRRQGIRRMPFSRSPRPGGGAAARPGTRRARRIATHEPTQQQRLRSRDHENWSSKQTNKTCTRRDAALSRASRNVDHRPGGPVSGPPVSRFATTRSKGTWPRADGPGRPLTSSRNSSGTRRAGVRWWARADSNGRPRAYQARALTG